MFVDSGCNKRMADLVALIHLALSSGAMILPARLTPRITVLTFLPRIRHNGERVFAPHKPRSQVPALFSNDDARGVRPTHSFIESDDLTTIRHHRFPGEVSHFLTTLRHISHGQRRPPRHINENPCSRAGSGNRRPV